MQSIFGGRLAAMWDFMHAEMCNNEAKNQSHVAAGDWFTISDNQWSGRFLGIIIGWDPSVCKSNRLHVDILRFSFIKLGYILL